MKHTWLCSSLWALSILITISTALPKPEAISTLPNANISKAFDRTCDNPSTFEPSISRVFNVHCYLQNHLDPPTEVDNNVCFGAISQVENLGVPSRVWDRNTYLYNDPAGNCFVLLEKPQDVVSATFSPWEIVRTADRILKLCSVAPEAYGGRTSLPAGLFPDSRAWKVTVWGRSTFIDGVGIQRGGCNSTEITEVT